jgi:hypothetical protein
MSAIASTAGRLNCEFVVHLFLHTHRKTDRFFAASGVQLAQSNNMCHYRVVATVGHHGSIRTIKSGWLTSPFGQLITC